MKALLRALRPPRKLRVTSQGKWFIALTVGVGAAAINTGNNLLYLALSMNLSLIILSGLLSELCIRGLRIRVTHASEAFASRESLLLVTCSTGRRRFPAISVSVSPDLQGAGKAAWFPGIPPGGSDARVVPFLPRVRGPVPPFLCTVSTRFPFSLFEKSASVRPGGSALIVYPEPAGTDDAPDALSREDHGGGKISGGREGTSIRGARDHLLSDPVRDIHWKASARLGKWMVKEREAEPPRTADVRLPAPAPPREFERLVSRACGLVLRCEREGTSYRLRVGDRVVVGPGDAGRRGKALSVLSMVEADGTIPPRERGEGQ